MVVADKMAAESTQQKVLNHLLGITKKSGDIEVKSVARTLQTRGTPIDYYDVVKTFRQMEDAGMGRLIVGRRGGTTRFRWGANGVSHTTESPVRVEKAEGPPAGQVTITFTLDANSSLWSIFRSAVVSST